MYLLFVDESGTHGGSHAFVLGGIAVHEDDASRLQVKLDRLVANHLGRVPPNLEEYELHAAEMRNAKKPKDTAKPNTIPSVWSLVDRGVRLRLLEAAYKAVAEYKPVDSKQPLVAFSVIVDSRFRADDSQVGREKFAYEVLLNKFDMMLKSLRNDHGKPNRGLVIHDERLVAERDIQAWTSEWRKTAGKIGQLKNLADVPLFADSRATRLLQIADLVSYASYRRYAPGVTDHANFDRIWTLFHATEDAVHGCVHYTPTFGQHACHCQACSARQH